MRCPLTLGVILAGGLARRLGGGDKPLLRLGAHTLLDHVAARLGPQCDGLILNANGEPTRFRETGLPVVSDSLPDHPGPLAGILAALEWAATHRPLTEWVVSAPGDTPFIPDNLVERLHEVRAAASCPLACASSGLRIQYAVGLWPVHLRHDLRDTLARGELRSIRDWAGRHGIAEAKWPSAPLDPFLNVNTPEDLAAANALVEQFRTSG